MSWRSIAAPTKPSLIIVLLLPLGALVGVLGTLAVQHITSNEESIAQSASAPPDPHPDLRVTLSSGLLTALLQQSVDRGAAPVPFEDIAVVTRDGEIVVQGDVRVLGRRVRGTMTFTPVVEQGSLRLRLVRAKLGPLPVPDRAERVVEDPVNARLAASLGDVPATITGARSGPEGLTVTARVAVDDS
jgi:hypothetical protein